MTRFILLLIPLVGYALCCCGQSAGYKLETFGTRDGLLSSKIFALAQGNDRMLWIGTELGVSRYDGYSFRNYQYTTGNESIGRILCITQDSSNRMWIGGDKGLFYFSGNGFRAVKLRDSSTIAVEAMLTDDKGNLWIGEMNALYKITASDIMAIVQTSNTFRLLPHANFKDRVYGLAADVKQNIYVSNFNGVFQFPVNSNSYNLKWANTDISRYVRSVAAISPDSIFWNSLDAHPGKMIRGVVSNYYDPGFVGRTVFTNRRKVYALTTSGIALLNGEKMLPLVSFRDLVNNAVAALIDEEENVWVGTWEGLLKYRKTTFRQYQLQHDVQTEAFSFLERTNGELLFGSNRGKVFIKKEGSIVPHSAIPALFPLAEVMCMVETPDGSMWFGSGYQGISRVKEKRLTNWKGGDSILKDNNCEALYTTADGKLMACTEQGVTLIDPMAAEPMQLHYPFKKKYARYPELFGCFHTRGSVYWFYGSQGLYALRNNQLTDDSIGNMGIKNLYINKIVMDRKENIWVATLGKGLLKCRLKENKLILEDQYDAAKGLPSDNALSVIVDKNDNVWWGDYMSISVLFDPGKNERLITFNENDGLLSSYYQTLKLEQQRDGTIWGLTSMGLVSFHPDSIASNNRSPVLILDKLMLNHKEYEISYSSPLRLPYNKNSPEFHFTAVSLTDPSKIRYAYRLKELDTSWTYSNNRSVNFNFLQAGHYTFEIKACNNNNVWSPVSQFSFIIRPPFWKTWWFLGLALLFIAMLIYGLFRRRIKAFKTKASIQQQMTELEAKALRAQMNPHFIFNSLNAIQELIVTKNFTEAYQYLSSFSKLLRMVLNNSEKNFIALSAEIEMNRLYLELESLRFKRSFRYSIRVEVPIDEEMTQVPSLLLQPFLENAIWHGLMHKQGEKILAVYFKEIDNHLVCTIEDNGIGREKAAIIKAGKIGSAHFESKGMSLSQQRIDTLNQQLKENLAISVEDIRDSADEVTGTRVTITIPKQTTFIN